MEKKFFMRGIEREGAFSSARRRCAIVVARNPEEALKYFEKDGLTTESMAFLGEENTPKNVEHSSSHTTWLASINKK